MNSHFTKRRAFSAWPMVSLMLAASLLATGCERVRDGGEAASPAAAQSQGTSGVSIDSVSYRHDRSMKYTLFDLSKTPPQAIGGEIVGRLASGGSTGCCLALPATWRPGLRVRVEWTESDRDTSYPEKHSRDIEIARYDKPAGLFVVFYPPHEVEVVVSGAEPGHPEWTGQIKQTPWDYCVETNGRKPCKAALPKLFDAASRQGYCTSLRETKVPDGEELCSFSLYRCMQDYEDEPFCKSVLWGPRRKQE